jgi:hypothetical protein
VNCVSTTDHYLAMRALLVALDRWVNGVATPPPSAYPSLHEGTLMTVDAYRAAFPRGIGLSPPHDNLREPRLDFGPRFASESIADRVPPLQGRPFESRVPAPDADGNDRGGVGAIAAVDGRLPSPSLAASDAPDQRQSVGATFAKP